MASYKFWATQPVARFGTAVFLLSCAPLQEERRGVVLIPHAQVSRTRNCPMAPFKP